ncbi:rRNA maturation RNase YbeY [soil metagenome]
MPGAVAVIDEVEYSELRADRATALIAASFFSREFDPDELGEVSIALVGRDVIWELNKKFRGKDAPTDVLSFELDGPYGEMVGEIVISPECANPAMTVEELVVHGALHLAGMDHGDDFDSSEMATVQARVLEMTRA